MRNLAFLAGALALAQPASAEVVRFELTGPPRPALEGRTFGTVGPYVEIRGRVTIALDPVDPRNAVIADLDRAPRNRDGRVEATADVILFRPADLSRGNGTLLVEPPNRGRHGAPGTGGGCRQWLDLPPGLQPRLDRLAGRLDAGRGRRIRASARPASPSACSTATGWRSRGRQVYDALVPHIPGARRTFMNARWAQPGRNPSDHTDRLYPADQFPFAYAMSTDPLTGARDGLLRRCRISGTCPRIFQTDSEFEFWGARGSLTYTDAAGRHLDLPPEVRGFMVAGHPHYAAAEAMATRNAMCQLPINPLQAGAPMRALLVALEAWVREGVEPPSSRVPMLAHGTLAPAPAYPAIPGLPLLTSWTPAPLLDLSKNPPEVTGRYPILFPRVDGDGNAIAGIRLPAIEAPRATYTG